MFHKFVNRYIIEGELVAATALHIGAAKDEFRPNGCKNPFFRNASGLPLIPGSSLKGAMRSFLEQYLSSEAGKEEIPKDIIYRSGICNEESPCIDLKAGGKLEEFFNSKKPDAPKKLSDYLFGAPGAKEKGKLCIVCRLFGSPYSAAKLSIRDARVIEKTFHREFEIRSGVAIDRNFGTSAIGKKFETEVVPEGTRFSFQAILENGDATEWKIVQQLIRAMELGLIPIGGMKSRGLGEMRIEGAKYQDINGNNIAEYLTGKIIEFQEL